MDWLGTIKDFVLPGLGLLGLSGGFLGWSKMFVGRRAKEADLFDRTTKEVAVRSAILKLKNASSDPKTVQRIKAGELAYRRAESIEAELDAQLTSLGPSPPKPDLFWLRNSSARELFWPRLFEGGALPNLRSKFGWWGWMIAFYAFVLLYFTFFMSMAYKLSHLEENKSEVSTALTADFVLLLLGGLAFLLLAFQARRKAYVLSLGGVKHFGPAVPPEE